MKCTGSMKQIMATTNKTNCRQSKQLAMHKKGKSIHQESTPSPRNNNNKHHQKKKLLNMDFVLICTFYTDITLQQPKISTLQQPNDKQCNLKQQGPVPDQENTPLQVSGNGVDPPLFHSALTLEDANCIIKKVMFNISACYVKKP